MMRLTKNANVVKMTSYFAEQQKQHDDFGTTSWLFRYSEILVVVHVPALASAGAGFFEYFASPFRVLIGVLVKLYLIGLVTQSSFHGSEIVTPSVCTKAGGGFV